MSDWLKDYMEKERDAIRRPWVYDGYKIGDPIPVQHESADPRRVTRDMTDAEFRAYVKARLGIP